MERLDSSQNTPEAVDPTAPVTVDLTDATIAERARKHDQPPIVEQAKDQAMGVAEEAKEQVRAVAQSAGAQARGTLRGIGEDVSRQVEEQKGRVAQLLRELGDELDQAAGRTNGSGPDGGRVATFAGQAATLTRDASGWLDTHRPGDLVEGLNDFARRRPMTFIAASAIAGLVMGRLTRGMFDVARDEGSDGDDAGGAHRAGTGHHGEAPVGGYGYSVPATASPLSTVGGMDPDPLGTEPTGTPGAMDVDEEQHGIVAPGDTSPPSPFMTPGTTGQRGEAS